MTSLRLPALAPAAPPATTTGGAAWLVSVPCALATVAAILWLGPPLGRALELSAAPELWPAYVELGRVRPEPTEQARYLLALLGPPLACAALFALRRRDVPGGRPGAFLRTLGPLALVALVAACFVAQIGFAYEPAVQSVDGPVGIRAFFTRSTLLAAAALAAAFALALGSARARARLAALARETAARRRLAVLAALLLTAVWLLSAFNTDDSLAAAHDEVWYHSPFWLAEAYSVLDGGGPLVDFHAQYGHLWAYGTAAGLTLLGTSFGAYAALMLAATAAALLAVFAILRRVTGSSLVALALFAPVLAHGFFMKGGPLEDRYSPAHLFSLFPIRYAGPYVLAWLVARHIDGHRPRQPWVLVALGGLVAVNNPEFGLPALGATLAALAWAGRGPWRRRAVELARAALLGGAVAVGAVSLLTLATAGELPRFGMLATFPEIFATSGFGMLPMRALGLHVVVYLTFAAALVVATACAIDRREDPLLPAMLAWIGVFGLGAGAYFAGRSHPEVLIDLFSIWALALALLLVAVVRTAVREAGRPALPGLLVAFGFALAACSLAQTPTPWSQLERLEQPAAAEATLAVGLTEEFADERTQPGEKVALLMLEGHVVADRLGLVNVSPYAGVQSMMARRQWDEAIAALRAADGRRLFLPAPVLPEQLEAVRAAGFRFAAGGEEIGVVEFDDAGRPRD